MTPVDGSCRAPLLPPTVPAVFVLTATVQNSVTTGSAGGIPDFPTDRSRAQDPCVPDVDEAGREAASPGAATVLPRQCHGCLVARGICLFCPCSVQNTPTKKLVFVVGEERHAVKVAITQRG